MTEELIQRGFLRKDGLTGTPFGKFEELNIGQTTLATLLGAGLVATLASTVEFPFKSYKPPKYPRESRPDKVYAICRNGQLHPIAVAEHKSPANFRGEALLLRTAEQALHGAATLGVSIAIATDGTRDKYIDVSESIAAGEIIYYTEQRTLNPAVLDDLLAGGATTKDPAVLSERVWQHIWHATKDEPKECLLTFVEIFIFKFLSDNLPNTILPASLSFYEIVKDVQYFEHTYGISQIEYYVSKIRPHIKQIFPENTICDDSRILSLFGLSTIVSRPSVINGFSFLRTSTATPSSYNKVFLDVLSEFEKFGPLTSIDPEFKLRLYETFLKKSFRRGKLGQFFTPRNVVRSIVKMARLERLPSGAVCLDPAAGVGGFVLEPLLLVQSLKNNVKYETGKYSQRIRFIGVDAEIDTHILAKANLLIHFAEEIRNSSIPTAPINRLMADTFILLNENETLGSLEYPPVNSVDVIMTNPPYVTKGSRIYKETISELKGTRNGLILKDYYAGCGLGLESLFLRYISGALKPGGIALVIVPQGLLTRTETGTKELLLDECNLLASIALPRNTFFNTAQKTYILCLEKRHAKSDPRPSVFCAIARTIGESLDYRRFPTPMENDLEQIADSFILHSSKEAFTSTCPFVKVVEPTEFSKEDRWDIYRFWSDDELVALGERLAPVGREAFMEELSSELAEIHEELEQAKSNIAQLTDFEGQILEIGDSNSFRVRRGKRVTRSDCDKNPGEIPVFSGSKDPLRPLGNVARKWLDDNDIPIESKPIVTVNANGYVGAVFVRRDTCVIHDDVMIVEVLRDDIDLDYLALQLEGAIAGGNFEYEAKLYNRVKELEVKIPTIGQGAKSAFDLARQVQIAQAVKRLNTVRQRIHEVGGWANMARIAN